MIWENSQEWRRQEADRHGEPDHTPVFWCSTCGEYEVSAEGQECSECLGALEGDDGDHAMDLEDGR